MSSRIAPPNVTDKSSGYDARIDQWRKIRDVLEGEDQVKDKRTTYMPRPKAQDLEAYTRYVDRSNFYAVAERTVRGLVGLVFRITPMLELPERVDYLRDFATPDGHPLDTLLRDAVREVTSLGRYGILVDMGEGQTSVTESTPFLAPYEAEAIWRWDEILDPVRGKRALVRVIVEETPATHQSKRVTWLRELFLEKLVDDDGEHIGTVYRQQLWRDVDAETRARNVTPISEQEEIREVEGFERVGDPITPLMNGKPLKFIPFWFINTFNMLPRPDKPPMLDLANMNLAHWRNSADYEQLLHLVGSPTPWISANFEDTELPTSIGAGTRWLLPAGAQVGVLEFSGTSADAFVKAMDSKEERMAALGARLIRNQERANVTAETQKLQATAETSVLMNAVQTVELAFNVAIKFLATWAGATESEVDDIRLELNKDFFGIPLSANDLKELVAAWQSGAFSRQTLHENLQRGEIIDPKRTLEEETELMEAEAPEVPDEVDAGMEDEEPGAETAADEEADEERQGEGSTATKTGAGGSDGHAHAIEGGKALARTPGGRELDHEHSIEEGADRTSTDDSAATGRHSHPL